MATKYENYITGDDGNVGPYGVYWRAQTFTPSLAHTITSVKLLLYRFGAPGTATVNIRDTVLVSNVWKPTSSNLCSGTTDCSTLADASPYTWREITLGNGTLLLASTVYAIVVSLPTGDGSTQGIYWRSDATSPAYAGGITFDSSDSGATWAAGTRDFMFEDWGEPPVAIALTLTSRSLEMTLPARSLEMSLQPRSLEMTLPTGRA